jgi:hypothetical protein
MRFHAIALAAVLALAAAPGCIKHAPRTPAPGRPVGAPQHNSSPHRDSDSPQPVDFNKTASYTYAAQQDGFSVQLPETHRNVERETAPIDTPLGTKTRITHSAEAGDLLFMVTLIPLPELNMMNADQQRDSVKTLARALAKKGELISLAPEAIGQTPAWRARYTADIQGYTLHFTALVFYRSAHITQLQAAALNPALLDTSAVALFLNKFELF